jgi:hypothetical protein
MRYFVPDIRFACELAPQSRVEDKLGGQPWGLPPSRWPRCRECGSPMSFVAQLQHDALRLDLGGDGRVVFIFQCESEGGSCRPWDGASGANAAFVLDRHELLERPTAFPDANPPVESEVRIPRWLERSDRLPFEQAVGFFDEDRYARLPAQAVEAVSPCTKAAGVPHWVRGPAEIPPIAHGWCFAAQFAGRLDFYTPPLSLERVNPCPYNDFGITHVAPGHAFGGGLAYLFVRADSRAPRAQFFWQPK